MAMTCPSCQQPLPEPPPRFCPTCGYDTLVAAAPVEPDVAAGGAWPPPPPPPSLPPTTPPGAGGGAGGGTPWERRRQIGFASAFVETTQQVLFSPTAFFRAMPVTGGITDPLLYGVLAGYVGLVASALYRFVLSTTMGMGWGTGRGELDRFVPMLSSGFGLVMQLLFGPILIAVGLFIVAAVMHLCLMVVGGAGGGFEGTFRVVAYAEAAMLFSIIPLCGDLIGFLYWLVLAIIGFSAAHRISGARATVATLLPFVVLCCCCGGLAALIAATGGVLAGLGHAR